MYLFRWRKGGCTYACICIGTQTLTTELLDGCLWNLVGMKCSWHRTCIKVFWPDLPKGGSRAGRKIGDGGLLQESASSDWKATATNQMYSNDLEACGMKCCYFLFHSEVNFLCVHCSQVSDSGLLGLLLRVKFANGTQVRNIRSFRASCCVKYWLRSQETNINDITI